MTVIIRSLKGSKMTRVGFEPTPFRTRSLVWRLRPLGHLTMSDGGKLVHIDRNAQELEVDQAEEYVIFCHYLHHVDVTTTNGVVCKVCTGSG